MDGGGVPLFWAILPEGLRAAQYIIRNTKQIEIQKQNSTIKPNTRTPGKCIIVYYFSRPAGLPVLAVTYNDT